MSFLYFILYISGSLQKSLQIPALCYCYFSKTNAVMFSSNPHVSTAFKVLHDWITALLPLISCDSPVRCSELAFLRDL